MPVIGLDELVKGLQKAEQEIEALKARPDPTELQVKIEALELRVKELEDHPQLIIPREGEEVDPSTIHVNDLVFTVEGEWLALQEDDKFELVRDIYVSRKT